MGDNTNRGPEMSRSPFDGRPYYCGTCGADPDEQALCREPLRSGGPNCRLETVHVAEARARRRRPMTTAKPDTTATE
jgi:hypothetical protein